MKTSRFLILCSLCLLILSSCGVSKESKYEAAQALVSEGKYEEAITAFEELNGYEEAGKYIAYVKCLQLGENGQFDVAISSLQTLGDFKESAFYVIYYTARNCEQTQAYEQAAEEYKRIATFRDAADRLSSIPDLILDRDLAAAVSALDETWTRNDQQTFTALASQVYSSSVDQMQQNIYDLAQKKLAEGSYQVAFGLFGVLAEQNYSDSAVMQSEVRYQYALKELEADRNSEDAIDTLQELAEEGYAKASEKLNEMAYQLAQQLLQVGEYGDAAATFEDLGSYKDAATMVLEARYQQALRLLSDGKQYVQEACDLLGQLGSYKDSADLVKGYEDRYEKAVQLLNAKDYDAAQTAFSALGSFSDSTQQVKESQYQKAVALLESKQYDDADAIFQQLDDYADAQTQISECRYQKAQALLADGQYDEAAHIFREVSIYRNAAEMVLESRYQKATAQLNAGETTKAIANFNSLIDYKDSRQIISQLRAEAAFDQGSYAEAWEIFATLPAAYQTRNGAFVQLYNEAKKLAEQNEYHGAFELYHALGAYSDAADQAIAVHYQQAAAYVSKGAYEEAIAIYQRLSDHQMVNNTIYRRAEALLNDQEYLKASELWLSILDYEDSRSRSYSIACMLHNAGHFTDALSIYLKDPEYLDVKNRIYTLASDAAATNHYETAINALTSLGNYKDSITKLNMTCYTFAEYHLRNGKYDDAINLFESLGEFSDAADRAVEARHAAALAAYNAGNYLDAYNRFCILGDYSDSAEMAKLSLYSHANVLMGNGSYEEAYDRFLSLAAYSDSAAKATACKYSSAVELMNKGDYRKAGEIFLALNAYSDSQEKLKQCYYHNAEICLKDGDALRAVELYLGLGDYQNSPELLKESFLLLGRQLEEKKQYLQAYESYQAAGEVGAEAMGKAAYAYAEQFNDASDYIQAAQWYANAGGYSDAQKKLVDIAAYYLTTHQYETAEQMYMLLADQTQAVKAYYEIAKAYEKQKDVTAAARLYGLAGNYSDAQMHYYALIYNRASELMGNGSLLEAYTCFDQIREYADSAALADALAIQITFEAGNEVKFGTFQQDGDADGVKEPIEWCVIEVADGKALLLSKYALYSVPYNAGSDQSFSWETSDARTWLNGEFLQQAFNEKEREALCTVDLDNTGLTDQVFLLNVAETDLASAAILKSSPTLTAVLSGAAVDLDGGCAWLLREATSIGKQPYVINAKGNQTTGDVFVGLAALRPAIWIDLNNEVARQLVENTAVLAGMKREVVTTPSTTRLQTASKANKNAHFVRSIIQLGTGEKHDQGVVMDASLTNCYVEFDLPEDCREFRTDFFGFSSCSKSGIYSTAGKKFKVEFYLDDQLVQTLTDLTENDVLAISVPTVNAAKLTIRASNSGSYAYGYFALANVTFVTGNIPSIREQNPYLPDLSSVTDEETIHQYLQMLTETRQQDEETLLEGKYQAALRKLADANYPGAYALFGELIGYKDVDRLIIINDHLIKIAETKANPAIISADRCKVGETVAFGQYEQDNNLSNGKEDIQWLVLEIKDDTALLISKYCLTGHPYSSNGKRVTWDQSLLRTWLNDDFYRTAFTEMEQKQILLTEVTADKHPDYADLDVGTNTQDYVYLLSYSEALQYFASNQSRKGTGTAYAFTQNVYNENGICYWWLRTPASSSSRPTSDVHCDGKVGNEGRYWYYNTGAVRPVVRIDLTEDSIAKMLIELGLISYSYRVHTAKEVLPAQISLDQPAWFYSIKDEYLPVVSMADMKQSENGTGAHMMAYLQDNKLVVEESSATKLSNLAYVPFTVSVSVPANTCFVATYTFDLSSTKRTNNGSAVQMAKLIDVGYADIQSDSVFDPGAVASNALVSLASSDYRNAASDSTVMKVAFNNQSNAPQIVNHYFALYAGINFASVYEHRLLTELTITAELEEATASYTKEELVHLINSLN